MFSYEAFETYHVVLRIDLDKKIWSLAMNGNLVVEDCTLPDFMQTDVKFSIKNLSFGSNSGNGSEADSSFAIANVKMKRLR